MAQGWELAAVRCVPCGHVQSSKRAECRTCGAALKQAQPELALQVEVEGRDATSAVACAHAAPSLFAALEQVERSLDPLLWRRRRRWHAHAWVGAGILCGATLLLGLPHSLTPAGLARGLCLGVCLGAPLGYVFSRSSTM